MTRGCRLHLVWRMGEAIRVLLFSRGTADFGSDGKRMTKLVFSSDWHLGHRAILGMQRRPFANVEEMGEHFVRETNRICHVGDRLFLLGDISNRSSFESVAPYIEQLRCKHISLVFGNHDERLRKRWTESGLFEFCGDYLEVNPKGYCYQGVSKLVLCHYPLLQWNRSRYNGKPGNELSLNLHGHLHSDGSYNRECKASGVLRYDVGVEANGYRPVLLEDVLEFFGCGQA